MQVKFDGNPLEVQGVQPKVGEKAPNAKLVNAKGETVELADFLGKVTIISVIPNVLTRTCELQTKRFDEVTSDKDIQYVTVGRNTVEEFNQWNSDNELNVTTLTDAEGEFGKAYGLDIDLDGNALLTRAVFVVDSEGTIQYVEIVDEVVNEPDYKPALEVAEKL
ncbi:redoxin domain-containing protein [Aerococcaceae bacterium DSM 109653]|uniref:Redoxin domain-containing protein n=1 Tax=Fundicoccus ignavus TaxID=2664442 RepID=A0A844BTN1_9LACT|nr:redoxin family protein [Fundicoccus ignavus]MRI81462.1 redoxin domain-containing protein [Fundicoccus ignavus]